MPDAGRTKEKMMNGLKALRQRIAELEASEAERKRVEEALKESEARYKTLIETALEGISITDQEEAITFANRAFAEMLGYKPEELVGQNLRMLVSEEDWLKVCSEMEKRRRGESSRYGLTLLGKGTIVKSVIISAAPFCGSDGRFLGSLGVIMDITERKKAEEALRTSEERYRDLYDNAPVAYYSADTRGIIRECNKAAHFWLGYLPEELLGKNRLEVYAEESKAKAQLLFENFKRGITIEDEELTFVRKDGQKVYGLLSINAIKDKDGHIIATRGVVKDITERKRAEETLQKSEKRYKFLYENSPSVNFIIGIDGTVKDVSSPAIEKAGYTKDEIIGKPVLDLVAREQREEVALLLEQSFKGEYTPEVEIDIYGKDESIHTLLLSPGQALLYEEGQLTGILIAGTDITERKKAEERLQESETRYRNLTENLGEVVYRTDPKTFVATYVNKAVERLYGYTAEEWLKNPALWEDSIYPEDKGKTLAELTEVQRKVADATIEYRIMKKDKTIRWVEDHVSWQKDEYGKVISLNGVMYDITERKRAEEALRESEEHFRALVENAFDCTMVIDKDEKIQYVTSSIKQVLGYDPEEWAGKQTFSFLHPDDVSTVVEASKHGIPIPSHTTYFEVRFRHKDGSWRNVETIGRNLLTNPAVRGIVINFRDITERRRAKEALKQAEGNFRRSMDDLPLGIRIVTADGELLYANKAILDIYGYSSFEELKDTPTKQRYTPEAYAEHRERVRKRKQGEFVPSSYEISIVRKDGQVRHLHVFRKELLWNGEGQFQALYQDITERKLMEEERLKFEKLESVGILAGGIAHDFNNILTGILGNITLAERHIEPGGKAAERLLEAKKASLRAKDLTQQLLTFSKGGVPIKKVASIAELLEETATFALRGSKVKCEFSLSDDLWAVEVDQGQMSQVITNIVINADEAMPGGGIINIGARNTVIKGKGALPLPKGNYVEITVKDYGIGIPKEHLGRIFDPYFTTKQKGSGLGLATAYSVVRNHHGYITVESELGVGTTFHIYLPASEKPALAKKEEAKEIQVRGKGRILVMDDEEMIREMLSRALSLAGYEVELTGDGAEAVELYQKARESRRTFDAVILDLTVPGGMGGNEAMKKLLEIDPEVKAIVSSGYATDPIMADFKKYGFSAVVTKPYSVGELERTLHRMLR